MSSTRVTPAGIACLTALLIQLQAAPVVLDFSPKLGPAGTNVTVTGSGFGTEIEEVLVSVGGVPATVVSAADDSLTLQVPANSGRIEITVGSDSSRSLLPFVSTRSVDGTFQPPAGMNAVGYNTGHFGSVTAGASFSATVSKDAVSMVWAWREEGDPLFGALVYPDDDDVIIDATSTALVLVGLSPLVPRGDPATIDDALARIVGSPELLSLVQLIEDASAAGYNYLNDGRFNERFDAVVAKAITPEHDGTGFSAFAAYSPPGTGLIRVLRPESPIADARLDQRLQQLLGTPPGVRLIVEKSEEDPSRLNQNVEVWRADPAWFTDGFEHIARMSITDRPTLLSNQPVAYGTVAGKLGSANLDPGEWVGDFVKAIVEGHTNEISFGDDFSTDLPGVRSGVYMVNAFSGNVWFGSTRMDAGRSQSALISQIDPNNEWTDALVVNLIIGGLDLVATIFAETDVLDQQVLNEIVKTLVIDVSKTVADYQAVHGEIDLQGAAEIAKTTGLGLAKALSAVAFSASENPEAITGLTGSIRHALGTVFGGLARLSSLLQAGERIGSLVAPTHYAVERAVVVVGDPFAPQIRSFAPASGRAGDRLQVHGDAFTNDFSNLEFAFVKFEATGNPPQIASRLVVTPVIPSSGVYHLQVPPAEDWIAAFGEGDHDVYLALRNTVTDGQTTTQSNPAPYHLFHYKAPPEITAVVPNPVRPGRVMSITGPDDFDPLSLPDFTILVDGSSIGTPFSVGIDRINVVLPLGLTIGPHTLQIGFRDPGTFGIVATSNSVNFTIPEPTPPEAVGNSRTLNVSRRDWSDSADGQLSLYEALALAAGTLGRSITVRPEGEGGGNYESDWIDFPVGSSNLYGSGENVFDTVVISGSATGGSYNPTTFETTVSVTSPLPKPGNGDDIQLLRIILDGAGLPEDTLALDLRGVSDLSFTYGRFLDFPGDGIVLGGGSTNISLTNLAVEGTTGSAVVLEDDASDNRIENIEVLDAGGHGLVLSGAGVVRNVIDIGITDTAGHGILLEDGAAANRITITGVRDADGDGIRMEGADTAGNVVAGRVLPVHRDVANSGGHGVHVLGGAHDNTFANLAVSGSTGDGFRLDAGTSRTTIVSCATGFDFDAVGTDDFVSPNGGNSVLVRDSAWNTIGSRGRDTGFNTSANFFGGSMGGATLLITGSGSHHNVIDASNFGYMDPLWTTAESTPAQHLAPAATHAIHLVDGAHDNQIGSIWNVARVNFLAVPSGAAVRIEGNGTDNNRVVGSTFGSLRNDIQIEGQEIAIGVHVLDLAAGNQIGEFGGASSPSFPFQQARPNNVFGRIEDAAVRLEAVAASISEEGEPIDANHVINNSFGLFSTVAGLGLHPEVAIHLKGQVSGQWIGGPTNGYGNNVSRYGYVGLWIDGGVIPSYQERNRITKLWTSSAMGTRHTSTNTDPFAGPVSSHGLLISNGASGQVVGEDWEVANDFGGGRVAAYLDGGSGNRLRASMFDGGDRGTIFLRDGTGHRIGGSRPADLVRISRSGTNGDGDTAGIVLAGGGGHRVEGAFIGDRGFPLTDWGSLGHGILIHESSGNRIGGPAPASGNVIVSSVLDGIHIRGTGSTGNEIGSNRIGFGSPISPDPANAGAGIHFSGGAHDNLVGGLQAPWGHPGGPAMLSPNGIQGNTGDGVLVTGGTTTGNRILSNSITGNGGKGIRHASGGNRNQPPPAVVTLVGGNIEGSVGSLASTPAGSTIEVFMNPVGGPDVEGDTLIASGQVASDGTFSFPYPFLPPAGVMSATATHATTGDTSEFTNAIELPDSFGLHLATPAGESAQERTWPAGGAPFAGVVLTATSDGSDVEVRTLSVKATGDSAFIAAIDAISLFEDVDGNGVWSAPDRALSDAVELESGVAELELVDARVAPDESRRWVLRLHPASADVPVGSGRLEVENATAVDEFYWQPLGFSGVAGTFPLRSALFTASGTPGGGDEGGDDGDNDGGGDGGGDPDPPPDDDDDEEPPVAVPPVIRTHPGNTSVAAGANASFSVVADGTGSLAYQWYRNGVAVAGATGPTLLVLNVQPRDAGLYSVTVSNAEGSQVSRGAFLSVSTAEKLSEGASEITTDEVHPNGNVFDEVVLTDASVTVKADPGQVTRVLLVDLTGDIIHVELSGAGTFALSLDNASGPAAADNYDMPGVTFMKGHATISVTGADETSNLTVFSLGSISGLDTSVFRDDVVYDGVADVALVTISSTDGKFGGIRMGNASFFATSGMTGIYAPGVDVVGPVNIGNIRAADTAEPVLVIDSAEAIRVAGGDLEQENERAIQVEGVARMEFTDGTNSHGETLPAQTNQARFVRDGVDVTDQMVED